MREPVPQQPASKPSFGAVKHLDEGACGGSIAALQQFKVLNGLAVELHEGGGGEAPEISLEKEAALQLKHGEV